MSLIGADYSERCVYTTHFSSNQAFFPITFVHANAAIGSLLFHRYRLFLKGTCCFSMFTKIPLRQYHYVNISLNWSEAQLYCREKYTDLATFDSLDDLNRLKADFSYSWAWIGLHDDPAAWKTSMGNKSNSWRWSATGQTSITGYQSWNRTILDYLDAKETCVTIIGWGLWNDLTCNYLIILFIIMKT
uniref:C-type lectin domain-containing protein n=1 Tax=Oryzias latipes TaxID=8090 RepID=A0A3P9IA69_ORYLA